MQHSEEMDALIDWFLTAHECHMNKLQNAAVAYLTVYHQREYIAEYGDGEVSRQIVPPIQGRLAPCCS